VIVSIHDGIFHHPETDPIGPIPKWKMDSDQERRRRAMMAKMADDPVTLSTLATAFILF